MTSAICCYFLHYHYIEYMSGYMSLEMLKDKKKSKLREMMAECRKNGIKFVPPSVNQATNEFYPIDKNTIMLPINFIDGLSDSAVKEIESKRPFMSFEHFKTIVSKKCVNKTSMAKLIKAGAFNDFEKNKNKLLCNHDNKVLEQFWCPELDMQYEREVLGISTGKHPLDSYVNITLDDIEDGKEVAINCIVNEVIHKIDKNGKQMCFIKAENSKCSFEVVVFAWAFKSYQHILSPNIKLTIQGKVDGDKILCNKVNILS